MRGATLRRYADGKRYPISIHAPLAGCDRIRRCTVTGRTISIHAPLAGCDAATGDFPRRRCAFQSTHPLRGATSSLGLLRCRKQYFNPRTPCGVRPRAARGASSDKIFQSTHPLRGATRGDGRDSRDEGHFNPRTPCGVRLSRFYIFLQIFSISIHAPLAGCDIFAARGTGSCGHFNPRTPCGVRRTGFYSKAVDNKFQSTHP